MVLRMYKETKTVFKLNTLHKGLKFELNILNVTYRLWLNQNKSCFPQKKSKIYTRVFEPKN